MDTKFVHFQAEQKLHATLKKLMKQVILIVNNDSRNKFLTRFYKWYKAKKDSLIIPDKILPSPRSQERMKKKVAENVPTRLEDKLPLIKEKVPHNAYIQDGRLTLSPLKPKMQSAVRQKGFKLHKAMENSTLNTSFEERIVPKGSFIMNAKITIKGPAQSVHIVDSVSKSEPRRHRSTTARMA